MSSVFFRNPRPDEVPFVRGQLVEPLAHTPEVEVIPCTGGSALKVSQKDIFPCSASIADNENVPDNAQLQYLDEANLLQNVSLRYHVDQIYTYTGTVLLAINPYRNLPDLYEEATMDSYRGRALGVRPPHVYGIAERARRMLVAEHMNQSIIVSGESGAGKTESCRAVVQYLAYHSRHDAGELSSAVLAANPILEAFGCAVTTRNRNSSRFGKLMKIWTSAASSTLSGSSIDTYLLEKGRVSHHSLGERTFHVLYYFSSAAANKDTSPVGANWNECTEVCKQMEEGASSFTYLRPADTNSEITSGVTQHDAQGLQEVALALKALGATSDELAAAWKVIGAILHLGNLRFTAESSDDDKAVLSDDGNPFLCELASLLGVDSIALANRLRSKTVVSGRGSNFLICYTTKQAVRCRDGLAQELYGRLFSWVVKIVNRSLRGSTEDTTESGGPDSSTSMPSTRSFIAILDIFGFENLECNSLEQLLINHTNERLQLFFLRQTLKSELDLYRSEGIPVPSINYDDNSACVELVGFRANGIAEARPNGIVWHLEDECAMPKPSDANLVMRLENNHKSHQNFVAMPQVSVAPRFCISHFAGTVTYDSHTFVHKNSNALHPDLPALFSGSTNPFVVALFSDDKHDVFVDAPSNQAAGQPPPSRSNSRRSSVRPPNRAERSRGVAGSFCRQLEDLMLALGKTTPHYIRCIKPNTSQAPNKLCDRFVLQQLRYGGTPQLLQLMGKGFPTRCAFDYLCDRYRPLLPGLANTLSGRDFVQALLAALNLKEATSNEAADQDVTPDFALGVRLAFFSSGAMAMLDSLVHGSDSEKSELVAKVQAYMRRRRWRQALSATKSVLWLARRVEARRALMCFALRAIGFASVRRGALPWKCRAKIRVQKINSATVVQAHARGFAARKWSAQLIQAALTCQRQVRLKQSRRRHTAKETECRFRVIEMQRRARGMLSRKYQGELRSARLAATVLQAGARRMFARTQLSSLKSASLRLLREYNRQQTVRAKAALQLQSAARVLSSRRERASLAAERDSRLDLAKRERQAKAQAKEVSRAATRVQSSWRRIQAGRQLCVLQEEAKLKKEIALAARRERAHKAVQRSSAVRLQCMWRSITAVHRLNQLREEAREASAAAARRRARAAEVAAQRLRRAEAAVIVQAAVRGLIGRRSSRLRFTKLAEERAALLSEARRQMTLRVASTTFLLATHASTGAAETVACMAAMRLQARWRALILKRREYAVRESEEKARAAERAAIEQKEAMAAVFSDMEVLVTKMSQEHKEATQQMRNEHLEKLERERRHHQEMLEKRQYELAAAQAASAKIAARRQVQSQMTTSVEKFPLSPEPSRTGESHGHTCDDEVLISISGRAPLFSEPEHRSPPSARSPLIASSPLNPCSPPPLISFDATPAKSTPQKATVPKSEAPRSSATPSKTPRSAALRMLSSVSKAVRSVSKTLAGQAHGSAWVPLEDDTKLQEHENASMSVRTGHLDFGDMQDHKPSLGSRSQQALPSRLPRPSVGSMLPVPKQSSRRESSSRQSLGIQPPAHRLPKSESGMCLPAPSRSSRGSFGGPQPTSTMTGTALNMAPPPLPHRGSNSTKEASMPPPPSVPAPLRSSNSISRASMPPPPPPLQAANSQPSLGSAKKSKAPKRESLIPKPSRSSLIPSETRRQSWFGAKEPVSPHIDHPDEALSSPPRPTAHPPPPPGLPPQLSISSSPLCLPERARGLSTPKLGVSTSHDKENGDVSLVQPWANDVFSLRC